MLNHNYIKSHYRLIALDLSQEKRLAADPKATDKDDQNTFALMILEKFKKKEIKLPLRECNSLLKDA